MGHQVNFSIYQPVSVVIDDARLRTSSLHRLCLVVFTCPRILLAPLKRHYAFQFCDIAFRQVSQSFSPLLGGALPRTLPKARAETCAWRTW
jgi:hypothetical protein